MSAPKPRLAALFVVIVTVLVGGAAVVPYAMSPSATTDTASPSVENAQFQPDAVLPAETAETGTISMESNATDKTVLVDVGHANDVSESDLEPLLSTLVENGHRIRFYRGQGQSFNESLRGADALVVASPQQRFSSDQLAGVEAFTDAGGRVLVLGDPPSVQSTGGLILGLSSPEPTGGRMTDLGSTYGLAYGSGYLYNMETNDNNYKSIYARSTSSTVLTDGVDRVVLRDAAPLRTDDGTRVLAGSDGTRLSTTRETGPYAVAVRSGNVAAVGDSGFVARENAYDADNDAFIGNLADFLVDGEKTETAPAEPGSDRPPRPPAGGGSEQPTTVTVTAA